MTGSFNITAVKREGGKLRTIVREQCTPFEMKEHLTKLKKAGWRVTPRRIDGSL